MTKIWKLDKADSTEQHFWTDEDGAHISSTGDHDTSGFHQLLTSVKNAFMHGTTELMTISADLIELGKNSTSAVIKFCAGTGEIGVIGSMLTLFSDKVGVKGNSKAILASNGESNIAASKQNTTYAGLSQMAATAPSTDADPATALLQAKCTKNSDSSAVSETYISLTAKPDGTAPATVKASDITVLSSRETNPYIAVKNDADTIYTVPAGCTIALTTMDSYGQHSDGGISFDGTNVSLGGANIVVNGETYSMPQFMTAIQPVVLYNGGAALDYDTTPGAGTDGTVTLSETAANFKELVVWFTGNSTAISESNPMFSAQVAVAEWVVIQKVYWQYEPGMGKDCIQFSSATCHLVGKTFTQTRTPYGNIYSDGSIYCDAGYTGGALMIRRVMGIR